MQIKPDNIKNILAVRNDRFGEFLLNIPAFRALKESYRFARLIVIAGPDAAELARCVPLIDEVIIWGEKGHSLFAKLRLIHRLRSRHIDIAVILNPSKEAHIITYLAGIPVRAGYHRKWGFLLTRKIKDKKHLGARHEVEYNLELVGLIGAQTQDKGLCLSLQKNEIASSLAMLAPRNDSSYSSLRASPAGASEAISTIALHPWTSDSLKQWPIERFVELARRLASEGGIKVIVIGGRAEAEREGGLFSALGDKIINLAGSTTLSELAALLKGCLFLVSCDSGPVHLACSVGTPVIALFRSDIPGKRATRWGPWGAGNIVIEKNSLSEITVEEVFSRIKEKLGKVPSH